MKATRHLLIIDGISAAAAAMTSGRMEKESWQKKKTLDELFVN